MPRLSPRSRLSRVVQVPCVSSEMETASRLLAQRLSTLKAGRQVVADQCPDCCCAELVVADIQLL